MDIDYELQLLREGNIHEVKHIYFGVTEKEIDRGFIEYKSPHYTHKGVNTSLEGLKRFIKDHDLQDDVKSYAIIPLNKFIVDDSVYPNKKYDMISVKLPFKIGISSIHKL